MKTFEEIKKNPNATAKELSEKLQVSSRTIKTHFSLLKEKGFIEFFGGTKNGHWIVLTQN